MNPEEHVEQPVENTEVQETQQEAQEAPQVSHAEQNWRQVRQELEQMRYEKQRLEEMLRQQHAPKQEEPEEDMGDPSDLVTKAELKKYAEKLAKKQVEKLLAEREHHEREREKNSAPAKLKQKFSDFDQVVTPESLQKFAQQDPELAESLGMLASDPYKQGIAVYKALKAQQPQKTQAPERKIERPPVSSSAAPKSSSALSNANLFANGLTPELKEQLYKEMEEASRRY